MQTLSTLLLLASANLTPIQGQTRPGLSLEDQNDLARMQVVTVQKGRGTPAVNGDTCYVEYTGSLTNGTVFDSNANGKREPFAFALGKGQVIRGWELGVHGMKPGEVRRLTIPSDLAYGDQAIGTLIPPASTLVFQVKLFDTLNEGDETTFDFLQSRGGTGRASRLGDKVAFQLDVRMLNDTLVFSSGQDKAPLHVALGDESNGYSPGLMAALVGTKAGGTYEVRMPPVIAVGTESKGARHQLLKYSIRVVSVVK